MMSEANLAEIEDAGWSFVIGGELPEVPYAIKQWRAANPDREPGRRPVLTPPGSWARRPTSGAAAASPWTSPHHARQPCAVARPGAAQRTVIKDGLRSVGGPHRGDSYRLRNRDLSTSCGLPSRGHAGRDSTA